MTPAIAVALLLAAGLPVAFLLTRRVLLALLIAPMVSAVTAAIAVFAMLVVGGDLRIWLPALLVAQYALVAWRWRPTAPVPFGTWVDVLCLTLPLIPPILLVLAPPVQWDAHSIWWTHAAYYLQGGAFARHDMGASAYFFSHPDYPPLASATVAGAWLVFPGDSFTVAQFVSTALNLSAIGTLGFAVRSVTSRAPVALSRLAGVAVGLAAWGGAPYTVAGGLSDPLWAVALVGAAALLLLGERPLARPALPLLLLTVAALSKNDALPAVLTVAVLVTIRERRQLSRVWLVWAPVAAAVAWVVFARSVGARSEMTTKAGLTGLFSGDRAVYGRVPPTLSSLWSTVGVLVVVAAAVALFGWAFLRRQREALGLGSDLWLWSILVVYTVSLVFIYTTATTIGLAWYLVTSMDRVTLPIGLLACLSAVGWGTAAVDRLRRKDKPQPQPDLDRVPEPTALATG